MQCGDWIENDRIVFCGGTHFSNLWLLIFWLCSRQVMQIAHYMNERALRALWQELWLTFFSETKRIRSAVSRASWWTGSSRRISGSQALSTTSPCRLVATGHVTPRTQTSPPESTNNFCRWNEKKGDHKTRINTPLATFLRLLFSCLGRDCLVKQRTVCA